MSIGLKPILYAGREVWPLIEGGKGVSATNHASSGAWAAAGGIGRAVPLVGGQHAVLAPVQSDEDVAGRDAVFPGDLLGHGSK